MTDANKEDRDSFITIVCSPTATPLIGMVSLDHNVPSDTVRFSTGVSKETTAITIRFNSNSKHFWTDVNGSHVLDHTQLLVYFYVTTDDGVLIKVGAARFRLSSIVEQKSLSVDPIQLCDAFGLVLNGELDDRLRRKLHVSRPLPLGEPRSRFTVRCLGSSVPARLSPPKHHPEKAVVYGRTGNISDEEFGFEEEVDRFIQEQTNRVPEDTGYTWYYTRNIFNTTNMGLSFLLSRTIESNEGFWLHLMNRTLFVEGGVIGTDFFAKMLTYYLASFATYRCDFMGDEYMEVWFPKSGDCEDFGVSILQMYRSFVACKNIRDERLIGIRRDALKYIPFAALNRAQIGSTGNKANDFCSHVNVYFVPKGKFYKMLDCKNSVVPEEVRSHLKQYEDEGLPVLMGEGTSPYDTSFQGQSAFLDEMRNELRDLFDQNRAIRSFKRGVTKQPFNYVFSLFTTYFMDEIPKCNLYSFVLSSRDEKKSYGVELGCLSALDAENRVRVLAMPIPSNTVVNISKKQALLRPQPPVFRFHTKQAAYEKIYSNEEDVGDLDRVIQKNMGALFADRGLCGNVPQHLMNSSAHVLFIPHLDLIDKKLMTRLAGRLEQLGAVVDFRVFRLSSSAVCCDMRVFYAG